MYNKLEKCRICGNRNLVKVLDLGVQSLTGVFPRDKDHQDQYSWLNAMVKIVAVYFN